MALLTLISVVLVGKTLTEMQIARDAAYHPCIVMNPIKEKAEWDKEGDLLWLKDKTRSIESTYEEEGEDGEIYGTMKLPLFIFNPSSLIKYSAVNIFVLRMKKIKNSLSMAKKVICFNVKKLNLF